jgi:hypothetical protein
VIGAALGNGQFCNAPRLVALLRVPIELETLGGFVGSVSGLLIGGGVVQRWSGAGVTLVSAALLAAVLPA